MYKGAACAKVRAHYYVGIKQLTPGVKQVVLNWGFGTLVK